MSNRRLRLTPAHLHVMLLLADAGLIRETEPPDVCREDEPHEDQRRYYELTRTGREHLAREIELLDDIVEHARGIGFEPGSGG